LSPLTSHHTNPRPGRLTVRSLLAVFLLVSLLGADACKRSAKRQPKRSAEAERHEEPKGGASERRDIALELKSAVERAGGPETWIKGATSTPFPPRSGETPVEVLTAPTAFDSVLSALKAEAGKRTLETRIESKRLGAGRRFVEIRFSRGQESMGRWRLREVRQLLRAAIVVDDLGQNFEVAQELLDLPYPLTFSVLPRLSRSLDTAEAAHRAGREVMLHLPMEPDPGSRAVAGAGAIKVGMSSAEVVEWVKSDLATVPYARGVNNHMGSRATADRALMKPVMETLAERRMYFIDSRTTPDTVALDVARELGIPAFYRSVFLDNTQTTAYTLAQLRELCRVVRLQGVALAIGHPYPTTVAALREFLPELEREDIQLVPPSKLVRLPEVARLSPPHPSPAP
jgi:uncharacterized protein